MNSGNNKINIRKNTKRPVLHLIADIESGEYYALIDDGTNKREVHRKVTEESQENFNRVVEKSRRNKIMTKFNIGKKEVKNVETIAYKTLEDFDRIYNTDYSEKYVKIVTMEIKETKLKRKSSLTYRKFCEELRREKLRKASIVIEYNLPVRGGLIKNKHKMGIIDKLKFIKYALKSKRNGAEVDFKLNDGNKNYRDILKTLPEIKIGDKIVIETSYGRYTYQVYDTKVVKDTQIEEAPIQREKEILMLYTCYPTNGLGHAKSRFLTYSNLVQEELFVD